MNRRDFIKYSSLTAGLGAMHLNGFGINPSPKLPFLDALLAGGNPFNRVMVLIQLYGGNDGLNTFIPLDQYENLSKHRKEILIPEKNVLKIRNSTANGFHPAMTHIQDLYNNQLLSVVQNVGYPNQDYSHFRSSDIWMSASDAQVFDSGWIGRYLQMDYPDFPQGYPTAEMPDPLAIQIGSVLTLTLLGNPNPMGFAISDPQSYHRFVNDVVEEAPDNPYGHELSYIRLVSQQAETYYEVIKKAAEQGRNLSARYPSPGVNYLADQLRIVAQLISGGLRTPVYVVSMEGFDTHGSQVDSKSNTTKGIHANLLGELSEAVGAFQDDLEKLNLAERVAGMTFSEFGRTIAANGSLGTDHGAAAPIFVFGTKVNPGIIGINPQISKNLEQSQDLPMHYDFRSVYASVLQDWFGVVNPESVLFNKYPILPIFQKSITTARELQTAFPIESSNYPNPFRGTTTIQFTLPSSGWVSIRLLSAEGNLLETLEQKFYPAGAHEVVLHKRSAGVFFYQIQLDNKTGAMKKILAL